MNPFCFESEKAKKATEKRRKNKSATTTDDIIQRPESCTTSTATACSCGVVKLTCDLIKTYQSGFARMAIDNEQNAEEVCVCSMFVN